ncbi:sodium:solute symporter [Reichenbachiella carrageenanivorans]|uniref:Sodium:solute symporter n=1 Tax=Reichenbachiella carrageenanivorans TaxID=2979869 RepID=A0ABY6D561_9BACT|nr:sodium:solute symporter [Reichenbachiella carrageenanivorans]UXX81277.1 sodium:solute symporter [Reichenbachiella carrageenanivorans]
MLNLQYIDITVICVYFLCIFLVAIVVSKKSKKEQNSTTYFLGGKEMGWFVIGASLFASNIGSEHLIGLAGTAANSGVAVAQFELLAGIILLLLGWVFVPFYLRSGVFTMPEFLELRYSKNTRAYLSVISIVAYILTKISVTIAAGGIIFQAMGIDFWAGAVIIVVITGIYTTIGGLKAVIYTDMIQMFVLIAGSLVVTILGIYHLGGWSALMTSVDTSYLSLWKPISHPDFPWTGIIFGAPILGVWYWCTDQFIVQRVLAASNIKQARRGSIFGGYLKMLPLFIFVIPGIIALAMSQNGELTLQNSDDALPMLVKVLLPSGLKGLVLAGLLAALMSSLSSVFNSCSTIFTLDIYKKIKPASSEKHLVLVGRLATVGLVVFGLLWVQFIDNISDQLFTYIQSVQAYISPPIAAVFLLGIFFKRLNSKGAMASMVTGFVLGIARLIGEVNKVDLTGALFYFCDINFLHFAIFLFVICVAVLILVSLLSARPDYAKIDGVTFNKLSLAGTKKDLILSGLLVGILVAIWIYFS